MGEPILEHSLGLTTSTPKSLGLTTSTPKSVSPNFNINNNNNGNGITENQLNGSHSSASSVHNDSLAGSNSSTSVPPQICNGGGTTTPSLIAAAFSTNKIPATVDYLTQLLKDKKQLAAFPNVFLHMERLVDDEINRVRVQLFQFEFTREPMTLPEATGEIITKQEKVFVPVKEFPEYNFVGRILGPRGMTAKQLEQETGCKIMVRGKGSMRDKKKEDANKGKPNWEHLNDELHVLIQCEDAANRVDLKIARAVEEVKKLLVPSPEGEDELKKKQLMELAIINGTFRQGNGQNQNGTNKTNILIDNQTAARFLASPTMTSINNATMRSPALAGAPLIMQPNAAAAAAAQRFGGINQNALLQQLGLAGATNLGGAGASNAAADYQQLLFGQQLQYDQNALAQAQLAQQQQLAAVFAANGLDYSAMDPNAAAAAAAAAAGGQLFKRR
uniref:K Homology domain-containing protein n=1 Tax=Panagrolaimus sp. PS1159 TaxID=55785 RepID=A0AC35FSF0_9BILA